MLKITSTSPLRFKTSAESTVVQGRQETGASTAVRTILNLALSKSQPKIKATGNSICDAQSESNALQGDWLTQSHQTIHQQVDLWNNPTRQ